MNQLVRISEDGKYILLKATGNISRVQVIEYFIEAHSLGRQQGLDRYLVDFTECRNTDTVLRNYTLAYQDMKDPRINQSARTALLVSPHDHSHDFIETLLRNSGSDVTLFHDRELAIWHLTKP
ncbi:MAG: hypothetical protein RBS68_08280 [Anaerolineales bacterium]|jgi:hypothetical protein|nr:hypothetical protein [Anaerolineales bacterium]